MSRISPGARRAFASEHAVFADAAEAHIFNDDPTKRAIGVKNVRFILAEDPQYGANLLLEVISDPEEEVPVVEAAVEQCKTAVLFGPNHLVNLYRGALELEHLEPAYRQRLADDFVLIAEDAPTALPSIIKDALDDEDEIVRNKAVESIPIVTQSLPQAARIVLKDIIGRDAAPEVVQAAMDAFPFVITADAGYGSKLLNKALFDARGRYSAYQEFLASCIPLLAALSVKKGEGLVSRVLASDPSPEVAALALRSLDVIQSKKPAAARRIVASLKPAHAALMAKKP